MTVRVDTEACPTRRTRHPVAPLIVVVGLRVLLVGLLALALFHQDCERFADKAMGARAATYPLAALVVPLAWLLAGRRRYPYAADALLMLPFVVDIAGNALDLYDRVSWFDDLCHLGNWALLSGALGCVLVRTRVAPLAAGAIVTGFGAITAILWELAEYQSFLLGTDEVVTIYRDTLGDEVLGLAGSVVAGLLTACAARRRPTPLAVGDEQPGAVTTVAPTATVQGGSQRPARTGIPPLASDATVAP